MARPPKSSMERELDGNIAPRPPTRRERLERFLGRYPRLARVVVRFWWLVPSTSGVFLLLCWILLSLATAQVLGAFLLPFVGTPRDTIIAVVSLTLILPLFIAPRYTFEPVAWGLALNVFLLAGAGLMAPFTVKAMEARGDWALTFLEKEQAQPLLQHSARLANTLTREGLRLIPVNKLEELFGPADLNADLKLDLALPQLVTPKPAKAPGGENPSKDLEIPALDPNNPYWDRLAATPNKDKVSAQEWRLFQLVTNERNQHGLHALALRDDLCQVAHAHSIAMRDQKFFDHVDPQGKNPEQRVEAQRLNQAAVDEIIVRVQGEVDVNAARLMLDTMLKNDRDRALLLDEADDYKHMGLGVACDGSVCLGTLLLMK